MIRRKLLLILGSLITLWVATAVVAITLADGVLKEIDAVREVVFDSSVVNVDASAAVRDVDLILMRLARDEAVPASTIQAAIERLENVHDRLRRSDLAGSDGEAPARPHEALDRVADQMRSLLNVSAAAELRARAKDTLAASTSLHTQLSDFGLRQQVEIQIRSQDLSTRFRSVALGLGIAFLVLINGSLLMLLRAASMILRPVDALVEATRRLGAEEFDYRVEIDQNDEFGQLGRAYNSLAAQLQNNEQRRLEMMQQVATTLNHELNNAIAIIDVQLQLVTKKGAGPTLDPAPFEQIHQSLERIQQTIGALKRIRRIVLTDYSAGVRMLDLRRSIQDDGPVSEPTDAPAAGSNET